MSTTGHETEAINVQGLKASLKKGGNKGIFNEAICSTAGATAAKVTNTTPPSFSLVSGAKIIVKFTYTISVANATLQVGSTAAKPIYLKGAALEANVVKAGTSLLLAYDGTAFNIIGGLGDSFEAGNGISITNNEVSVKAGSNLSFDANGNLNATDTTYDVMGASGSSHAGGLVPDTPSTAGTTKFLREDGTWEVPAGSTLSDVSYDTNNKKLQKTLSGTPTDIVTAHDLMVDGNAELLDGYTVIDDWGTSSEHYDLNDLTAPGVYVMTDSTKKDYFDNKAYDDIFVLKVSTNAEGNAVQRFIRPTSSAAYQRRFTNGAFSSWYLIEKYLPANMASASSTDHVVISEDWSGGTTTADRPSSVGWYRIGEFTNWCEVILYKAFNNSTARAFKFVACVQDGTVFIVQLAGGGTSYIDRVRVTGSVTGTKYFEFHYNKTDANEIDWKFIHGTPYDTISSGSGTSLKTFYTGNIKDGITVTSDTDGVFAKRVGYQIATASLSGSTLVVDASAGNLLRYNTISNISGVQVNNMVVGQIFWLDVYVNSSASGSKTLTVVNSSPYYCAENEDLSITIPVQGHRMLCFACVAENRIMVSAFANV